MDIFKEALAITPCKVQLNGKTCIVAGTSGNVIPAQATFTFRCNAPKNQSPRWQKTPPNPTAAPWSFKF